MLDVATQEGRFARVLMEGLNSYTEIIGVDVSERAIEAANDAMGSGDVRFAVMDAMKLEFEDESFDTVSISASLHHMPDIKKVLSEMTRVLKRGGRFIVLEMYRDARTEPEITSGLLHQWAAEIDSALGRLHNRQLARREILRHVEQLGMGDVESRDCLDEDSDPTDGSRIEQLVEVIGRITERAADTEDSESFRERGERLVRRLHDVGVRSEPMLLVTGVK